jgi:hypothetical protein
VLAGEKRIDGHLSVKKRWRADHDVHVIASQHITVVRVDIRYAVSPGSGTSAALVDVNDRN